MSIRKLLKPYYFRAKQALLKTWLAFVPEVDIPKSERVLIIAPHPDDEILGTGGSLIRFLDNNTRVCVAYLTDGEKSLKELDPAEVAEKRIKISDAVLGNLKIGPENVVRFHFPDGGVPRIGSQGFADAEECLMKVVTDVKPDSILVTHPLETWPFDHVAAFELTCSVIKKLQMKEVSVFGYWVWLPYSLPLRDFWHIDWKNTVRISVRRQMALKKNLMEAYLAPLAPNGKPWSGVLPGFMLAMFDYPYEIMTRIGFDESRQDVRM
ncbi:MAG: PIG-L family deacetylase [Chlorobium sp.]|uniref:PIG-L deacetylase family protein n=1 Tax=Chlorobium sp. TaxID=1095 RepID=UPI0025C5DCE9|nr:PIG-L family deacetylase [Chlorobium sp.]MCF8383431.1 PIG-L family deacetylase [Chlorobium sp.]